MEDCYSPRSDFVGLAASGDVPLVGTQEADGNLKKLIEFTRDRDKSNRDWATMALGMHGPNNSEVLDALTAAAADEDCDVRAEAIEALARRSPQVALPLVARELSNPRCGFGVFEAAGIIADPSLVESLKQFDQDTDAHWIDETVREAIRACEMGSPVKAWIY
jgi:hypothetical protein